ncbi:MAG: tRNA (adenosine(37)-N6)-threonylcarbamoyltransferase complex dimerization subunit type 1 TsaB [Nitrosomonas sp.]|nr:MAG: tRNA (adenosine(37)-N6)-threonylcarbamoyltransferase complex dimerization subunit type 1 TsaB [Nitrosomonas sp.]
MKILALETSTEYCSVALSRNGQVYDKEVYAGNRHSEILLSMIRELLTENGLTLHELDGIAFGAGPGSFTGLRIACGVAQGLAYALNLPVAGVNTLEAIAQSIRARKIIVALDARMSEIYHAAYDKLTDQNWQIISPPALCLPQHAPQCDGEEWQGCGSGFDLYDEILSTRYGNNLQKIYHGFRPRAKEIAQLALLKFSNGQTTDATKASPIYIRNKVALKENER